MFPVEQQAEVREWLVAFGFPDNDRLDLAALKYSNGDMDKLLRAIDCGDSRDLLMEAGFGYDVDEHNRWAGEYLRS